MPHYTVKVLAKELNELKKAVNGIRIGILGASYKANVDDTRDAPFFDIKKELLERKAKVSVFDPYVTRESTVKNLAELLKKSDVLLLTVNHKDFSAITPGLCKKNGIKLVIDGKNFLDKEGFIKAGIRYKGIGR